MDGGTQVISFILNFAVFGAAGDAHAFPEWYVAKHNGCCVPNANLVSLRWGNDLKYSTDRCLLPDS
jgi:hypothetical protein